MQLSALSARPKTRHNPSFLGQSDAQNSEHPRNHLPMVAVRSALHVAGKITIFLALKLVCKMLQTSTLQTHVYGDNKPLSDKQELLLLSQHSKRILLRAGHRWRLIAPSRCLRGGRRARER